MMKRIIVATAILFTLSACSLDEFVSLIITPTVPAPTPSLTETPTIEVTLTSTPTMTIVPTFTLTPTLVGGNSSNIDPDEEIPEFTPQPLPTLYVVPTITSVPRTSYFGGQGSRIVSMTLSNDILFWGYCDTSPYIDFDVRLSNSSRVKYVLLLMRLVDKGGHQIIGWGGGAIMEKESPTYYTYRVRPKNISHYDEFKNAWIEYQVVVSNSRLQSLGRTPVFNKALTLKKCQATEEDE